MAPGRLQPSIPLGFPYTFPVSTLLPSDRVDPSMVCGSVKNAGPDIAAYICIYNYFVNSYMLANMVKSKCIETLINYTSGRGSYRLSCKYPKFNFYFAVD